MSSSRTWVITGVSTGLGYSLALYVASQGEKVIGTVRSLSKFPEQLKSAGVTPLVVDLNKPDEDVRKAAETALSMLETVDVLVNNAGFNLEGSVEECPVSDFRAIFQTNFFGLIAFSQPFITHFRTRRAGHIINTSALGGSVAIPPWGAYCASKAAIDSLSDTLSSELKLFGVRVLNLRPGAFPSAIWSKAGGGDPFSDGSADNGPSKPLSTIYTDPDTQGYDRIRLILKNARETGRIGDPEKYAQRVYELVTGTGLFKELVARSTGDGAWDGPWEFNRVPLGTDSFSMMKKQWRLLEENTCAFETIARSTDFDEERLQSLSR